MTDPKLVWTLQQSPFTRTMTGTITLDGEQLASITFRDAASAELILTHLADTYTLASSQTPTGDDT